MMPGMKRRREIPKPEDANYCDKCGKPNGDYAGHLGPECQCGIDLSKAALSHSIKANTRRD